MWIDDPDKWLRLADLLLAAEEVGIDCETYNQPNRTSPQHRARVHCFSVAVLGPSITPRGYRRASGRVLPRRALDCSVLVDALKAVTLWAHNSPHDEHSLRNEGIDLVIQDSLQWARVACPGLKFYGLKEMRQWALGKPPRKEFKEMVSYRRMVTRTRARFVERCVCGAVPCRKRQTSEWWDDALGWYRKHERVTQTVLTQSEHEVDDRYPVEMFYPGSPLVPADRLAEWWDYSRVDAEDGIEIVDFLRNRKPTNHVFPWGHAAAI